MKLWQSRYNLQCKLSQQDLRNIAEEVTQTYSPHDIHESPELVLMPVDPINLYAYWNLHADETHNISNRADKQLSLRVYSKPELSENADSMKLRFDIKVSCFKSQQKVSLPVAAMAYSAVIGEINADNSFSVLATSNVIHVPRANPALESHIKTDKNTLQTLERSKHEMDVETNIEPRIIDVEQETAVEHNNTNIAHNTEYISETRANEFATDMNAEEALPEAFIMKNFNDYGYDLIVYGHDTPFEFKDIVSNQDNTIQLSTKNKTIHHNTSGLGFNL